MSVREEICKALECCAKALCSDCPYKKKYFCERELCRDARALLMGENKADPDKDSFYCRQNLCLDTSALLMGEKKEAPYKDSLGIIVDLLTDIRDALKN